MSIRSQFNRLNYRETIRIVITDDGIPYIDNINHELICIQNNLTQQQIYNSVFIIINPNMSTMDLQYDSNLELIRVDIYFRGDIGLYSSDQKTTIRRIFQYVGRIYKRIEYTVTTDEQKPVYNIMNIGTVLNIVGLNQNKLSMRINKYKKILSI